MSQPACGTSRNVLKIIQDAGYAPTVIEYVQEGWTKAQLLGMFAAANVSVRGALRSHKTNAAELGPLDENVDDEAVLETMVAHPALVNRPIVACAQGGRLCRPPEVVLDLLPRWPMGPYHKEDGALLIDTDGKRV